ncbi:MAG: hypothetical protein ABIK92_06530 [Pseudomonadota bacterium]
MTKKQMKEYQEPQLLRDILQEVLKDKKFVLDCGHHVTFGSYLGNDITIYNGKKFKIICSQCGY